MSALSNDDRAIVAAIAASAREFDPVPPEVIAAAEASLVWLDIDAELAELVEDTGLAATGVRSETASRLLVFTKGSVEIDVEVTGVGDTRRLVGQISPPANGTLEVRQASTEHPAVEPASVDEFGRFIADDVPAGLVSLRYALADGTTQASTGWVRI